MAGGVNLRKPNAQPGWGDNPFTRAFKSMPGDALQSEYLDPTQNPSSIGYLMPRNAARVDSVDGRLVPFDAQGQQLQFEQRPAVLPFYYDRSTKSVEMAVPGILDLIGDRSGVGAGELTGLADESQGTFMELFRRSLDKRAGERGISRKDMPRDFIRNKAPLANVPVGLLGTMQTEEE